MSQSNNLDLSSYLEDLFTFLRIPSISTQEQHKTDMAKAASFLKEQLQEIGFRNIAKKWATGCEDMPPIVYGERIDNPRNPTILVYNHYDVQPVDPLQEWKTNPFEPTVINGNIYGRGATDDKGQLITHLAALKELSKAWGEAWPINIKIIYEGQEESGGENLHAWLADKETQELLKADVAVVSDTGFGTEKNPTIIYGLRGVVYFQIDVQLSEIDLHSGAFGGSVLNPVNALVHILNKLYNVDSGKINIPGFYDDVASLEEEERKVLQQFPFEEDAHKKHAGNAKTLYGEEGYSHMEHLAVRPSLDINGIWGGFSGEGAKTIIPKSAHAKFSCRLVPNQQPKKIESLIKRYVQQISPKQVVTKITHLHSGEGIVIDRNSPWMNAAKKALEQTFGESVLFARLGGSIPAVAEIKKYLGIDTLLFGYSLPDDNLHAPNEKLSLKQFKLGIEANKRFYRNCVKK